MGNKGLLGASAKLDTAGFWANPTFLAATTIIVFVVLVDIVMNIATIDILICKKLWCDMNS